MVFYRIFVMQKLNDKSKSQDKILQPKFLKIKQFLLDNAEEIEDKATHYHKMYLTSKGLRNDYLKKFKGQHIKVVQKVANSLESKDIQKASQEIRKFGKQIAEEALKKGLTIEELVNGSIYLKQAIWKKLEETGLVKKLTADEIYELSQKLSIFIDTIGSQVAFTFHGYFLKAQEEQFRLAAIVESSDVAIVSKNLDGIVMTWNKGAEKIFGYKAHEIIGKSIRTIIPLELQYQEDEILTTLRQGKRIDHFQTVRTAKDGRRIDISLTVSPIKDKDGHVIGASKIARDITQEKHLERQKDEFLGIASHELKTPVTSIKSFAQLLKHRFTKEGNQNAAELIGKLDAQVDKLTNLIGDLLDITKIESGKMQFNSAQFSFDELVDEVVEELQRTTDKHVLIKKGKTGKTIYADHERISQVLNNLISNAIKYSPYAKEIHIWSSVEKESIKLCVQDFGVGIPKDKQDKVFERFFRASGPGKETYPGLGLGLYISSEIVKRLSGKIWVESIEGKGSTFCFTLPLKKAGKKKKGSLSQQAEEEIKHE